MGKLKRVVRTILIILCVFIIVSLAWTAFSLIGRVKANAIIPGSTAFRLSISNPVRLLDGILSHESLDEIILILPELNLLKESPLVGNRFVRLAVRGSIEAAILSTQTASSTFDIAKQPLLVAWDMRLLSPLLHILPIISRFANIPNLYYVQAGGNSRFEYRISNINGGSQEDMTFYIGPYRNLLFIATSSAIYESRGNVSNITDEGFNIIKPSAYDAAMLLSPVLISTLLSEQDASIAEILGNIEFYSTVEAGISLHEKNIELRLAAPLSSRLPALSRLLEQRSSVPALAELVPAASQYSTILSAGTLDELYQAALVFSDPGLEDTIRRADSSARTILGLSLDDLLFSWTGNEFAVFGLEGRPHPVYAIQIADERKRQEVFDRAFRSIVLNENVRLNLDGVRIPRIEIPEFLQFLLRRWNVFLPSPYYMIHRNYLLVSESAETLLSALRAMQRNDVLPRTAAWREIAGRRTAASAFSLYYSLDLSMPFFLRKNTVFSSFLGVYRQGLVRMSFDKGQADRTSITDISLVLVPGSGRGVRLVSSLPIDTISQTAVPGRLSNRVYGAGSGAERRIFLSATDTVISINPADNSTHELSGQGPLWIIPVGDTEINAWVVSERGRVTLVDGNMEPKKGFPLLTGLRLSSPPVSYNGRLYLCDEDGKVHTINKDGEYAVWETSFFVPLRSPPSFLTVSTRSGLRSYAAVYPKSFFGEIWLMDIDGKALPNWPVSLLIDDEDDVNTGIGFGSPLLFVNNNRVYTAFVCQAGNLFVFGENAAAVSPFPITLDGVFFQQPVFDGNYLWLVSSQGTLFRVDLDGEVLYQHIAGFTVKEEGYIITFDSSGDKVPDVFITGEGNALYAFTRNFRSLEGFPLPVWGMPYFAKIQDSRKPEIFGIGMDRRLYRWQFR